MLNKVIITKNVIFNKNILYSLKDKKQLNSYLIIKARYNIKAIKKEEI
jgi:hypothetical protein